MKTGGLMGIAVAFVLALIATMSVFMYVRGVEQEAGGRGEKVEVVVARQDILAGSDLDDLIATGAFTTETVAESSLIEGAVTRLADLEGQQTSAAILAGEQVTMARIQGSGALPGGTLGIPQGYQAVTLPLQPSRVVGGAVVRGDHVTIFGTFDEQAGGRASFSGNVSETGTFSANVSATSGNATVTLVPDVQVLKVVEPQTAGLAAGGSGESLVTLALRPVDAQKVVFGFEQGSVWLSLLPPGEKGVARPPMTVAGVLR